jgi:hypothetical protein
MDRDLTSGGERTGEEATDVGAPEETRLLVNEDGVRTSRWRVERMEVDSDKEQASGSRTLKLFANKAREGWRKVRQILEGKRLVREKETGKVVVKDVEKGVASNVQEEMQEWIDSENGGEVVVEEQIIEEDDKGSVTSDGSKGTVLGFDFLEGMKEDRLDEELEQKRNEGRKRKRDQDENEQKEGGMYGIPGWRWREKEAREDERWKREVVKKAGSRNDSEKKKERIPLPENFVLGKDVRGADLNHSGKIRNNFGTNKEALIPGGRDRKTDGRNWIASFTKSGCIACKDDRGGVTHKGRKSTPLVMVVGDESVPTVVGYTPEGMENSCAWVLKKEHLGLDEVPVPNRSKILVCSYVHLRRAGLEGYVNDFNDMVKSMMSVTGDCGIEVLPVVPVVFEKLDQVGKELISGLSEWIGWISEKSGRAEIAELRNTGGVESEERETKTLIWKPSFLVMHRRQKGVKTLAVRGNTLTMLRGERIERELCGALPAREIKRMMGSGGSSDGAEQEMRESF